MNVLDIDKGFARIMKDFRGMASSYVKVGVQANTRRKGKNEPAMAVVAIANEFGVPEKNIPSRPAWRMAFDEGRARMDFVIRKERDRVIAGAAGIRQALTVIGLEHTKQIQNKIASNIAPANAPSTAARKIAKSHAAAGNVQIAANIKTLQDTGQLLRSVRPVVVMK